MKEQTQIPVHKIHRASKMVGAGVKVGGNYLKYYAKKLLTGEADRQELDENNAEDIYTSLSELKGSALKAAQMLSMDQNLLPSAYANKFQMAQYSAPPLSYPLVVRTFQRTFGKNPEEIFDTFSRSAVNAASIGQVHKATIGDQVFAVKVQYPGVAESVKQDLKMAKPLAARIMNVKEKDLTPYLGEVESKLLEETDYHLELERSMAITEACKSLRGIQFPTYYPEYSGSKVITMDWMDGVHLNEWVKSNPGQQDRDRVGQALWDFYDFQIHQLRQVHADPHPGNFIVTNEGELAIIDFGCVKEIPIEFYEGFFQLLDPDSLSDKDKLMSLFLELQFILPEDSQTEQKFFYDLLYESLELLGRPFQSDSFDFSDKSYFEKIYQMADFMMKDQRLRKSNAARGSKDGIYINRTYFGLYSLLHEIGARITTSTQSNLQLA